MLNATEPCIALGSQQEINRLALLIDCPIQILPGTVDPDVRLIHPPIGTDGVLVLSEGFSSNGRNRIAQRLIQEWSTATPRSYHFFEMPVTQGIGSVLANAHQNHVDRKSHSFDTQHGRLLIFQTQQSTGWREPPRVMQPAKLLIKAAQQAYEQLQALRFA